MSFLKRGAGDGHGHRRGASANNGQMHNQGGPHHNRGYSQGHPGGQQNNHFNGPGQQHPSNMNNLLPSHGQQPRGQQQQGQQQAQQQQQGGAPPTEGWSGLDISHMGIRNIAPALFSYTHLTALYLSHNNLVTLPVELNKLQNLSHLDVSHNRLTVIHPQAVGQLPRLEQLVIVGNPLVSPPHAVVELGSMAVLRYLRERLPLQSPLPDRNWVPNPAITTHSVNQFKTPQGGFKVLSYNVLAESYATAQLYHYCPTWALAWNYRKTKLLREIMSCDADVLCLQEVELGQFDDFFQPELYKAGYQGVFQPKSRAKTMTEFERRFVDGCAIFYRTQKFNLLEENVLEFSSIALQKKDLAENTESFNRLIHKDNIAISVLLELRDTTDVPGVGAGGKFNFDARYGLNQPHGQGAAGAGGATGVKSGLPSVPLLVVNAHVHWNPTFSDVKVVQTQLLLEELENHWSNVPMIVAGDFNSMPDSAVYQLISEALVEPEHAEMGNYRYGNYSKGGFSHSLSLSSAYKDVMGNEPPYTNYTAEFIGALDYVFYATNALQVTGVLEIPELSVVRKNTALPNPQFPSDHLCMLTEFEFVNQQQQQAQQAQQQQQQQQQQQHQQQQQATGNPPGLSAQIPRY